MRQAVVRLGGGRSYSVRLPGATGLIGARTNPGTSSALRSGKNDTSTRGPARALGLRQSLFRSGPSSALPRAFEVPMLALMRLFDVIGLGVSNVATGRFARVSISHEEMRATFRSTLANARRYPARVMVMLGTPSPTARASRSRTTSPPISAANWPRRSHAGGSIASPETRANACCHGPRPDIRATSGGPARPRRTGPLLRSPLRRRRRLPRRQRRRSAPYVLGPLSSGQLLGLGPALPWYTEAGCL